MSQVTPGSTLLLSWENPAEIWQTDVYSVRLTRVMNHLVANGVTYRDIPWGAYEDRECADPCAQYSLVYLDSLDNPVATIDDRKISRTLKPMEICQIKFHCVTRDGQCWKNRVIKIDEVARSEGAFNKRLVTNGRGFANVFLMPYTHVTILPDGCPFMLDVVIPNQREIKWEELVALGSKVDVDPRFSIGSV